MIKLCISVLIIGIVNGVVGGILDWDIKLTLATNIIPILFLHVGYSIGKSERSNKHDRY